MAFFPSSSPSMFFKCICCRIFNFQPYHWAIASNNLIPNNSSGFPPQLSSMAQIAKPELAQSRSDKTWCQWSYWRGRCPGGIPQYTSSLLVFCKSHDLLVHTPSTVFFRLPINICSCGAPILVCFLRGSSFYFTKPVRLATLLLLAQGAHGFRKRVGAVSCLNVWGWPWGTVSPLDLAAVFGGWCGAVGREIQASHD